MEKTNNKPNNENIIIISILLVLTIFLISGVGMMNYGSYGMMSGIFSFGWVLMLLFSIALILLIIWLIKQINEKK